MTQDASASVCAACREKFPLPEPDMKPTEHDQALLTAAAHWASGWQRVGYLRSSAQHLDNRAQYCENTDSPADARDFRKMAREAQSAKDTLMKNTLERYMEEVCALYPREHPNSTEEETRAYMNATVRSSVKSFLGSGEQQ